MTLKESKFYFLQDDCCEEFGTEAGMERYQKTEQRYQALQDEYQKAQNPAIREHLLRNLFPPLAYYQTLRSDGFSQQAALELVEKETEKAALEKKTAMESMTKLPFTYLMYRLFVKKFMAKNFPTEGWDTQWLERSGTSIRFHLNRCLYWDICQKEGCPELCQVYCKNDDIAFAGLLPKIRFERSQTFGTGGTCCDFCFRKG